MELTFFKYQGTGNDFVMIDNRQQLFNKNNTELIARLCDRRFGIGADGLILLENHPEVDFKMVYYNADGNLSSMCGNGGRCITRFAEYLGLIAKKATFEAVDGYHEAFIKDDIISLKMNNVDKVVITNEHIYLDTGSPHHVEIVDNVATYDVKTNGKYIRYHTYGDAGANVNFVTSVGNDIFSVRTYERGVEDETLSCGTGVTAVAIAMFEMGKTTSNHVKLETPGGQLAVRFSKTGERYEQIFLEGPAEQVFKGVYL